MAEAAPRRTRDQGPSPWYTKQGAADYAGFSLRTIERAVSLGELRASGGRRPGGEAIRIHRDWLDEWLASRGT